ncbi:ABC transporter permease [Vitiosangium sp. GDMCC 1.1324]|uniref:ABC transporter permease n=1 Tax=Vitiosangium sp. (strain GDMCC 1.1324) TaxID=2138576 RepID=UPI003511D9AD
MPAAIVLGQSLVMTLGVHFGLGVPLPHPVLFVLLAATGSLTFLSLVMLLVRNLGDAGKGAAVLLLILQISSAGGAFPIELSHPFFQALHPLLPFTHLMKALRAVLFGAYGGHWAVHYLWLVATALTALGLALVLGRWKYVPEERYAPALDV